MVKSTISLVTMNSNQQDRHNGDNLMFRNIKTIKICIKKYKNLML